MPSQEVMLVTTADTESHTQTHACWMWHHTLDQMPSWGASVSASN
jgi:hypothetical protein